MSDFNFDAQFSSLSQSVKLSAANLEKERYDKRVRQLAERSRRGHNKFVMSKTAPTPKLLMQMTSGGGAAKPAPGTVSGLREKVSARGCGEWLASLADPSSRSKQTLKLTFALSPALAQVKKSRKKRKKKNSSPRDPASPSPPTVKTLPFEVDGDAAPVEVAKKINALDQVKEVS